MSMLNLKQIKKILDLDNITVIKTEKIVCFPKKQDDVFKNRFKVIQAQLKTIAPHVEFVIGDEGEIETTKLIEHKKEK